MDEGKIQGQFYFHKAQAALMEKDLQSAVTSLQLAIKNCSA